DGREELLEPAVLVHALIRARPRPELLAVVGVDNKAGALIGSCAKLFDRLTHVAERDEVTKLHASGEDDHGESLVLGDVRLAKLLRAKARLEKVLVIEDRVSDPRFGEERRKMRLPHPFGQPRAQRALSEDRVDPVRKRPNLPDAVA